MKLRSSSWLFFALVVVVALFGSACTDEKEWTQKVPEKDPCPDAVVVAGERHFDDGVLLEDTVITPPPICWYRVQGDDTLEPCSPATTKRTLDHARRSPHRFDENDGFVDSPIGVIVCLTTGRVLSIPATAATCAPTITPNEVWKMKVSGWSDGLEPRELLASDARPTFRHCVYELGVEKDHRIGCAGIPVGH